ncbi:glycosyl hydrolase family 61-domain-containing protein [Aspergillus germanicus]
MTVPLFILATLATAGTVSAHGYLKSINVAGQEYGGFLAEVYPWADTKPDLIAWSTEATDSGYVQTVPGPDVICHRGAKPGKLSAPIAAGGTVTVTWNQWLGEHKGPVLNYLAACNGDCANVQAADLTFFKISESGFENGLWGSDVLMQQGNSWDAVIPADIKAGGYVLRHEIVAMHGKFQLYPQCVNLQVTGGEEAVPEGVPGAQLYSGQEPGLNTNVWGEVKGPNSTPVVPDTTTITPTTFVTMTSPAPSTESSGPAETTDNPLVVIPVTPGSGTDTTSTDSATSTKTSCSPTYPISSTETETVIATTTITSTGVPPEETPMPTDFEMTIEDVEYVCMPRGKHRAMVAGQR